MKAKRRHELQENVLGSELAAVVEFFKKRGTSILVGLLIVAVIGFVIAWAYGQSRQKHEKLQSQLDQVSGDGLTPQERVGMLEGLSAQDDDKRIAAQAFLSLGNEYYARMIAAGLKVDPADRQRLADRAASYYRSVIAGYAEHKALVASAHLGLGKLAESGQDLDGARAEYEAALAIDGLAGHPVAQLIQESLDQLDDLGEPVLMASTRPARPQPATAPATVPATAPAETELAD